MPNFALPGGCAGQHRGARAVVWGRSSTNLRASARADSTQPRVCPRTSSGCFPAGSWAAVSPGILRGRHAPPRDAPRTRANRGDAALGPEVEKGFRAAGEPVRSLAGKARHHLGRMAAGQKTGGHMAAARPAGRHSLARRLAITAVVAGALGAGGAGIATAATSHATSSSRTTARTSSASSSSSSSAGAMTYTGSAGATRTHHCPNMGGTPSNPNPSSPSPSPS